MTWSLFGLRFGRPSSRRASAKGFRPTLELLEKRELLARLSIPTGIIRSPGQEVLVPVNLDDSEGLVAADVAISYDTTRLELVTDGPNPPVQKGTLTSDFDVFLANTNPAPSASPPIPGAIRVGLGRTAGPITGRGAGSILQINFRVRAGAVDGPAFINLMEKIDPRDGSQITTTGLEYENPPLGSQTGIAVSDVRQLEGNSGTTAFLFTVSLPSASTSQVTVQFATANGTATAGTAAPADYGATSGTLTFAPGVTRQIITVPVFGDTTVESDETFTVNLSNASSGTISRPTGTGTILNDDPAPTDASNDASDGSITVQNGAPAPTFQVTQHVATSTGFAVRFNRAVDTNVLNLYDQGGVLGPSDVTVTGPAGAVAGSIVMDADNRGFRFIATNRPPATPTTPTPSGVLTAGNYQVTLRSDAANGVRDTAGNALDGDANNTAGGNFVWNFLVPSLPPTAPQPVVLTIPDFVRGGGQPVDVPSTGASTGIPLTISRGAGVGQINFVLRFNPALLSITDFTVEPGINGTRTINVTGGTATIQVTAPAGQQLSASTTPIILGRFTATVPGNAPYASKQILDISNLAVFSSTNRLEELDSVDDDGIHVAAFLGETDGNQSYGAVDVTRLRQVILGTNSGFSAYQLADPTLIADIDNNGSLGAVDVTRLRQEILGGPSDRPEIPPLPGTPPPVTGVPDPQLTIGNVTGTRGQPVQVPITFTYNRRAGEPPQFEFLGAFLNIRFDTSRLTFVNAMAPTSGPFASAGLTPSLASGRPADQLAILIDVNNPPLIPEGGSGVMLLLNFTVNATAPDGRAAVNLVPQFSGFPQRTSINDDPAAVFPPPTDADNDPGVDGGVTIGTAATPGQLQFSAATYSVNENAGSATVTLTRTGGSDGAIAVTFASSGGTATAGVDFTATTTTVSFSAGQTVATVTIPIINDNIDESDETVNLALTGPTGGATLGTPNTAVLTIVDDDPTPGITINDVSANEGNSGTTPFVFTVSLSNPSSQPITVQFATANGTATAPSDYTATSGTLTLAAGQTSATLTVLVNGDTAFEPNETFFVNLSSPTNATLVDGQGQGTIVNDDAAQPGQLQFSAATYSVNENAGPATVTLTRTGGSDGAVAVTFASSGGTATAGVDFTAVTTTVSFADGQTSALVTIPIVNDTLDENDETVNLALSGPTGGATLGTPNTAVLTIIDDDPTPNLSISDVTVTEGNTGTTAAVFTVSLSAASGRSVTVTFATADGTATAPGDYAATSGTLTFAPGQTSQTVTVLVNGDVLDENDETFFVNLSGASNAGISDGQGQATILDDDPTPNLSINDVTVTEGNTGTTAAVFTVTLSAASGRSVTVTFATADGTATAPGDYAATSGTLTFAPGQTSQTVTVLVNGDLLDEADETFFVNLTSASNAGISDNQGQATIVDDDPTPNLSISDVTVTEGNTGTTAAVFTVSLSAASGRTVTVTFATADGTATAPGDYAATSGTLTFAPGQTSQTVTVLVNGDVLDENDETFFVNLSGASNAGISDNQGQATIVDDDPTPNLSISDVTVTEGNTGTTAAVFTVSLSAASGRTVTVTFATADGTAQSTAPADYQPTSGTLTFTAGQTSQTVTVLVNGDTTVEPNETFFVNLASAVNAGISDGQGQGTIVDDDGVSRMTISDVTVTEGNSGTTAAVFTVSLSAAVGQPVTVTFATADGTATAPADYTPTSGALTFTAGQTSQTVTVLVNGDVLDEIDETFFVNLSGLGGPGAGSVTLADNQGQATIIDDDPTPSLTITDVTVTEGNTGTTAAVLTVNLSAASGRTVTVRFATADDTAQSAAPADYQPTSGTLTFTAGQTSQTITVLVNGDTLDEANETLVVNLSSAVNAGIADSVGQVVILDDDPTPNLTISDVTVTEGNTGTTAAIFTVSLSAASGRQVTVAFATEDGTAQSTAPADYQPTSGTLTFTPGETARTITVLVNGDTLIEANETFFVNLNNAVNAGITDDKGQGTILDDDGVSRMTISDVTVTEGNSGTTAAVFTVSLSAALGQPVTITFATADGTATAPADYTPTSGALTFTAGQTSQTVTVLVNGDVLDEIDETFVVNLSGLGGPGAGSVTLADNQGQATIVDDDPTPNLTISDVTVTEGNSGTTAAVFTVSLSAASGRSVTVNFATADGTATAPADYAATSGTLTFTTGQTSQTVTVLVNGDLLDENDETFFVNLSGASNAGISDGQGQATIVDDDPTPNLSISDVTVTEGNTGTTAAVFTVSLSAASGRTVTVNFATADGTAAAPADYAATSGTLTFAPGQTSQTVTVLVNGDLLDEADETFFVNLSGAVNAGISDNQGQATIIDDDPTPNLSISDVTVTEGNSGTTAAVFTVSLSAASGRSVTVNFATADGTATAPADYAATSGTLTFTTGQTSQTVTVLVNGDLLDENDETFVVNLSGASNAGISDGQGQATILDDDPTPNLSISDVTVTEGNSGTTAAVFTVSLSAASGRSVTVNFATADGSAQSTAPADYSPTSGALTFTAGQTSATVTVLVNGDTTVEPNETFFVNLSGAVNAGISDGQGQATIVDDDGVSRMTIGDVTVTEGNAGTTAAVFTVSLSAALGQPVTITFATADGTATAPGDYAATSGTLTFTAGQTSQTVTVLVNGDVLDEIDETFVVNLSGLGGPGAGSVTLADNQGQATILDDDPTPNLSISDVTVTEGNAGTTAAVFTVSLSAASGRSVTVNFATADGTATAPADYAATSGTLTFTAGQTSATVTVLVNGDVLDENDETFFVNLSGASNAGISDGQGQATILDDDPTPNLTISDVTVTEGNSGTTAAVFTVSLSAASGRSVTVNFATADGTATAPADYAATSGALTFAPGQTSQTVIVLVNGDLLDEADETFVVNLSGASNAGISDNQGQATILDDDPTPNLSISDVTVTEGNSGTTAAVFTVSLSAASGRQVTVNFATADGTATAPGDYAATSGALTFAPGQTSQTVTVLVNGDTLIEPNETFFVNLASAVNAGISDGQGQATIVDDDGVSRMTIGDVTVTEGNAGTTAAVFTVSLSAALGQPVTVTFATADGTAQSTTPADYTATSGTLTFAAGQTSATVTVLVNGDVLDEIDETFVVNLSSLGGPGAGSVTLADNQGQATILDDDPTPGITINDVSANEGNSGTTPFVFTVSLSNPSSQPITVQFATANGTATAPSDYTATSGTLTLAAGQTSATLTVLVNGDTAFEPNETFFVNLSSPTNATLVDGQGQGTIVNDDAAQPGQLQFSAATYSVGEAAGQATITLTRTGGSDGAVAVTFASSGGTATAGVDFTAVTTTVSFSAGQTVATVTIPIINDNIDESDETVNLALSGPTGGATLGTPNTAVLTIIDDDPAPSLRISDVTVTEGNSGTTAAVFTVTLSAASGQTVTVNFATADGTATTVAPADYQFTSGVLTFSAGQTSQTVTVLVNGDTAVEPDETFFVNLSGAANATIADNQGQATIINDDLATVESVVINQQRADGAFQSQRSLVTDVTVTFNSRVTFVGNPVDAFRLVNRTTGAVVGLMAQVTTDATGAKTVVILRFTGAGIVNGSLADGRYELTVDGEMIRDAAGQFVDADNNGTAGGDLIYGDDQTREAFFRLFGDANGDGRVDLTRAVGNDVDLFFGTMLKRQGDPGYLAFFDYNGDGQIDGLDYFQFNQRRGRSI